MEAGGGEVCVTWEVWPPRCACDTATGLKPCKADAWPATLHYIARIYVYLAYHRCLSCNRCDATSSYVTLTSASLIQVCASISPCATPALQSLLH